METTIPEKPAETKKPEPKKQLRKMVEWIPSNIIELLKLAPANETIRSLLLAIIKIPIPEDKLTYEQIQEWVEYEAPIKSPTLDAVTYGRNREANAPAPIQTPPRLNALIRVYRNESGTCSYSVRLVGRREYFIPLERVMQFAEEARNWTELMEAIDDEFRSLVDANEPDMSQDEDGYQTEDYESNNVSDEVNLPNNDIHLRLRDLMARHNPQRLRQLE